jgi:hypothetical protein
MPEPARKSLNPISRTFETIGDALKQSNTKRPLPVKKKPVPKKMAKPTPARQAAQIETLTPAQRAERMKRIKKQYDFLRR